MKQTTFTLFVLASVAANICAGELCDIASLDSAVEMARITESVTQCGQAIATESLACMQSNPAEAMNIVAEMSKLDFSNIENEADVMKKISGLVEPFKSCLCPIMTTYLECISKASDAKCLGGTTDLNTLIGQTVMYYVDICPALKPKPYKFTLCYELPKFQSFSAEQEKQICASVKSSVTTTKVNCDAPVTSGGGQCKTGETGVTFSTDPLFGKPSVGSYVGKKVDISYTNTDGAESAASVAPNDISDAEETAGSSSAFTAAASMVFVTLATMLSL